MKRSILIFLFFLSQLAHAQTGRFDLSLSRDEYSYEDSIYCELKNDAVTLKRFIPESDHLKIDTLDAGNYSLYLYVNDHINSIFRDIKIKEGKTTSIYVMTSKQTYRDIEAGDTTKVHEGEQTWNIETSLFMLYGPSYNPNDTLKMLNDSYRIGFSQGEYFIFSKHYSLGMLFGSNLSMTRFAKGMSMDSIAHDRERYFGWNGEFSLMNRITFFNYRKKDSEGILFDFGATYDFPFLFRHVQADGASSKEVHHWIHQYTDVNAVVRLGYSYCTLQAEYRLLDFIQGRYPEIPPLRVGLALIIPNY